MIRQLVKTVIRKIGHPQRRDDIESHSAVGNVIERVEKPRGVEGMHECRRIGQPKPDMTCDARHQSNPRAHIEPRPADAVTNGFLHAALEVVGNAGAIAEENHVNAARFGQTGKVLENSRSWKMRADPGLGISPLRVGFMPRKIESQMHLPLQGVSPGFV
ncbi:MAG: hypothetical protein WDN50_01695 [Bradyrhizobium sp.]